MKQEENIKYFSYLDYLTYPVSPCGRDGERGLDNRGCTVPGIGRYRCYKPTVAIILSLAFITPILIIIA